MKVDLPKLKDNVVHLGKGATVSSLAGGKTMYRNPSDNEYVIILASQFVPKAFERLLRIFQPSQMILHFFEWDYIIDQNRDDAYYERKLLRYKEWA